MIEPTSPQLATAARTFGLLLAPVRLHLVALASCGEYDVGTLAAQVGVSVPTASQHLAKLRLAGLVSARREGRRQFYTVQDPHVIALVEQIFQHVAPDGSLAPDPPRPGSAGFPLPVAERDQSLPSQIHRTYGLGGSVR
ncbi:DNA-binding transcriptional ArsR family regulator [Kribbella sp. VKM Ac-2571]|uniref:ArsR/SmtB family transcription factor n=1 Tax=Kribbella sp. VKM Ac-2571 TaxID=2512222 RepID=UPI00105E2B38|nr:metalloregulator ArsR/SmtB family transcription factor [Kribbella sp. VKM Ac-2571]TDO54019.1 DNA-binding transcriptional ArsR family regulator [Kribbella sp. VKM Ac-2571]